jgi:hypothetical protein
MGKFSQDEIDAGLFRALHSYVAADVRWAERRKIGASNAQLREWVAFEFGISGGSGGPGLPWVRQRGGKQPKFWIGDDYIPYDAEPTLQGMALLDTARRILKIGQPIPAGQTSFLDTLEG